MVFVVLNRINDKWLTSHRHLKAVGGACDTSSAQLHLLFKVIAVGVGSM